MIKTAIIAANGSEEIETLVPLDVLRRAGVDCKLVSVCDRELTLSRGAKVIADALIGDYDFTSVDCVILPGGMPGAKNVSISAAAINAIKSVEARGGLIAAICAAPAVILAKHSVCADKKATCYPASDFIAALGDRYTGEKVCSDGNLITADGPLSSFEFAFKICERLGVKPAF